MADPSPGAGGPPGPHFPHEWDVWENYWTVHLSRMERLERMGLVLRDGISLDEVVDDESGDVIEIRVHGQILAAHDTRLSIDKRLDARRRADGRLEVRGRLYSYHAWTGGNPRERDLLRYDSSPNEPLHVHRFDRHGRQTSKTPIDRKRLPNLDQFIELAVALGAEANA